MKRILVLFFLLASASVFPQGRIARLVNDHWQFTKDSVLSANTKWQAIELPHTWNTSDVMDDEPGYHRAACWYKKNIRVDSSLRGKIVYLHFEGANQVATVFINGNKAGEHIGGYVGFYVPVTAFLRFDEENEVLVKVDNSHHSDIAPLSADFTFYGGIYRSVSLVALQPVHFACDDYGSRSVFVSTTKVSAQSATITVRSTLANYGVAESRVKIVTAIYNRRQKKINERVDRAIAGPGGRVLVEQQIFLSHPLLWSPEDPYLYGIVTSIIDEANDSVLDEIKNPLGLRWFSFDAAKGFFLNDRPLKLVGTSRHQDYPGMGNAMPATLAVRDVELIKEMGGNFLRVAHYPQDKAVLDACDRLGILTSVEIPLVNEITVSDQFFRNCTRMQVEMIRQYFNHPSIVMWCYMNEVLLRPQFNDDKAKQKIYFSEVRKLAALLDSVTRREDPSRYTMIAHHGDFQRYKEAGLIEIPMLVGWNLYSGWYGPRLTDLPVFLDQFHKNYPQKPMMVTEYGADADPRVRSSEPVRFDKSVEYTTAYHRYYVHEIMKRPFVAAAMIWTLADFNSETRTESMPHINNKGLMEWNRKPKDPYYYYKAVLQKTPFVKILGAELRGGLADSGSMARTECLQVAGSVDEIGLFVNGVSYPVKKVENGICEWNVAFANGANRVEVRGAKNGRFCTDRMFIECQVQSPAFSSAELEFRQLNILLGANRSFIDHEGQLWIPGHAYKRGGWGYTGGQAFKLVNNNRLPYGTDKNIRNTDDDPVYQTQQAGIESFRLDVPAGEYELTLHFAELLGGTVKGLEYNLDPADRIEPSGRRVFDVYVNDSLWLGNFNIIEQYGPSQAVEKSVKVLVKEMGGIVINFKAMEGSPVLNALQLKKLLASVPAPLSKSE